MISRRAQDVLERFPSCLELTDPDKTFGFVVDRLALELDLASSATGRIRRNHRLGEVGNEWDLQDLIDLHDFRPSMFEPLSRRVSSMTATATAIIAAPEDTATSRAELADLVGLPPDVFPSFTGEDPAITEQRLGNALLALGRYPSEMAHRREAAAELIDVQATGNGTVEAVLRATAALLSLEIVEPLQHHPDRYWHFATCHDRFALVEPAEPGSGLADRRLVPAADHLAIEENPFQPADVQPSAKRSGQRFAITRAGWEEVPVTARVIGIGDRCVAPMVVNLDTGAGVVFTGSVGDGAELRFERTGQITLDGADVSPRGFSFSGAVFAEDPAHANAFVWSDADDAAAGADRAGTFATTRPIDDGFARSTSFPHGGGLLEAPTLLPDKTRWAFFVREAHFGRDTDDDPATPGGEEVASATYSSGVFDEAVFDPSGTDGVREPSGEVGFDWEEREAFAVCVWLPRRFETLDDSEQPPIKEQIRLQLDRYRAAGVHVRVKYADDRWTLGTGVVRESDSLEPMGTVIAGTALFPDPTDDE